MPKRKVLTLTDKAADLLPRLAKKYHDQGAFVSQLIEGAAEQQESGRDIILARIHAIEKELADLKATVEQEDWESSTI